jgi:hypothetical protein
MKKSIIVIFVLFFMSCQKKDNEYLDICFFKSGVNLPMSVNCEAIRDKGFDEMTIRKNINNQEFISKLKSELKTIKTTSSNDNSFNTKIHIIAHLNEGTDTICVGLNKIKLNGVLLANPDDIINLIRNEVSNVKNTRN